MIFYQPGWYYFADNFKLLDAKSVSFMSDQIRSQKTTTTTIVTMVTTTGFTQVAIDRH